MTRMAALFKRLLPQVPIVQKTSWKMLYSGQKNKNLLRQRTLDDTVRGRVRIENKFPLISKENEITIN